MSFIGFLEVGDGGEVGMKKWVFIEAENELQNVDLDRANCPIIKLQV